MRHQTTHSSGAFFILANVPHEQAGTGATLPPPGREVNVSEIPNVFRDAYLCPVEPRSVDFTGARNLTNHFERTQIGCRSVVRETDIGAGIYQMASWVQV